MTEQELRTSCPDKTCIRVFFDSQKRHYVVSDHGKTYIATAEQIAHRFSVIFLACITSEPDCWICYDASDVARIASNRQRYEAVGTTVQHASNAFPFRYGIWDHARKELYGAMPSIDRHYGIMSESYESAQRFIDGIGSAGLRVPEEYYIFTKAFQREKATSQRIAEHNATAIDMVTALFNMPTKPAA